LGKHQRNVTEAAWFAKHADCTMTEFLHRLVEQYGLIAVFAGCLAEGESAAIFGGFFAHQSVFDPVATLIVAFAGAWIGDTGLFLAGRHYADHPRILAYRSKSGFSHAHKLIEQHPNLFVLSNRFIYGLRAIGGVAAGLSTVPVGRFMALNALSAAVWAFLFVGIGYFFGAGAEHLIGNELVKHERLLIGIGVAVAISLAGLWIGHLYLKKRSTLANPASDNTPDALDDRQ
jgi:membrane protein DedA with SNARE-associated domain